MKSPSLTTRAVRYIRKLNGCTTEYDTDSYRPTLMLIESRLHAVRTFTDEEIRFAFLNARKRAQLDQPLDSLLPETYALTFEVIRRTLGLTPFPTQILCGIILHLGKIAELKTGEGKTLAAVFPAVLNALTGKGVHILTFNEYLARRDALWMQPVYHFLGLRVGFVQEKVTRTKRQEAYACDITYLTAKESGFDYLRDGLCKRIDDRVHRPFAYAIVDEADSILVDEARVPLVIAEADTRPQDDQISLMRVAQVASSFLPESDFGYDSYARNIFLTDAGTIQAEHLLECENLYSDKHQPLLSRLCYALHAHHLLRRDVDYVVRDNEVELVDEFTGRIAENRRWPDGLQAAVEAKEGVPIRAGGRILSTISLQHFLQLYPKISGMTATAECAEEELRCFYGLPVVLVPPYQKCIRTDYPDVIFKTKHEKCLAVVEEIVNGYASGRPILVGTSTIRESIELAEQLHKRDIPCNVLNAKNDELEAAIIARAGRLGAVTISTNMAGRGTDIRLGGDSEPERDRVIALGGLYVIGTNRHESRRIDDQLRGRAGRQGDPGSSRFFLSLEDDLLVRFRLGDLLPKGEVLPQSVVVRREIDRIQRIVEGQNLEIKKTLVKYTSLIERQRKAVMEFRESLMEGDEAKASLLDRSPSLARRVERLNDDAVNALCSSIALSALDRVWSSHLSQLQEIKDCIHLRRLGRQDPLVEFQKLANDLFMTFEEEFERELMESASRLLNSGEVGAEGGIAEPSATWTYLINDDPFADKYEMRFIGDIGFSVGAGLMMPLTMLYLWIKRKQDKAKAG